MGILASRRRAVRGVVSGANDELDEVPAACQRLRIPIVALTGSPNSPWPTEATWSSIAVFGRSLSARLGAHRRTRRRRRRCAGRHALQRRDFPARAVRADAPERALGRRLLLTAGDIMRRGEDLPVVDRRTLLVEALPVMMQKRLGCVFVTDGAGGPLLGILIDGDLKRVLVRERDPMRRPMEELMVRDPKRVEARALVVQALRQMEENPGGAITQLVVVDDAGRLTGAVHMHDIVKLGWPAPRLRRCPPTAGSPPPTPAGNARAAEWLLRRVDVAGGRRCAASPLRGRGLAAPRCIPHRLANDTQSRRARISCKRRISRPIAPDSYTPGTNAKAWLYKILQLTLASTSRCKARRPAEVDFDAVEPLRRISRAPVCGPTRGEMAAFADLLDDEVKAALEAVPEPFRIVFILSVVEISQYQRSPSHPRNSDRHRERSLFRARKALQASLQEYARRRGPRHRQHRRGVVERGMDCNELRPQLQLFLTASSTPKRARGSGAASAGCAECRDLAERGDVRFWLRTRLATEPAASPQLHAAVGRSWRCDRIAACAGAPASGRASPPRAPRAGDGGVPAILGVPFLGCRSAAPARPRPRPSSTPAMRGARRPAAALLHGGTGRAGRPAGRAFLAPSCPTSRAPGSCGGERALHVRASARPRVAH
jgi:CBS domain-containing protein/DNA-directed RNA polymerase specialized sigma24 family protein